MRNGYARARTERLTEVAEKVGANFRSIAGAQRKNGAAVSRTAAERSVVEAAGIEPATGPKSECTKAGQDGSKDGRDESQVGHVEDVGVCPVCKRRTGAGRNGSKAGRETSTTGAQRTATVVLHAPSASAHLAEILDAWPNLAGPVQKAIAAIVRAVHHPAISAEPRVARCLSGSGGPRNILHDIKRSGVI